MIRTVIYFIDTNAVGGTEQMLLTLLAGLDRCQWKPVLVYHPSPGIVPLVKSASSLNVRTWEVPAVKERQGVSWILRFARELHVERPAVFHAHVSWPLACTHGLVAAILARIPAVLATQHAFDEITSRRDLLRQKLLSMFVHRYVAVSNDIGRQLAATWMFPSRKVRVIHNAISLAGFHQSTNGLLRASLINEKDRPIVLTVARLSGTKGLPYLLEAAVRVPEALFVVAGEGRERANLEAEITKLGIADRVILLGHRDDVPHLLASCDLFVLPSLNEGFPVSILEAMAAGKPVIASDVGGINEAIVHGETGFLVQPRDPSALAEAIRTLLSDRTLAQRLAMTGKARVEREFSAETMVRRTTQLYRELLSLPPEPVATLRKIPHFRS